jgi:hypothetical protein
MNKFLMQFKLSKRISKYQNKYNWCQTYPMDCQEQAALVGYVVVVAVTKPLGSQSWIFSQVNNYTSLMMTTELM